MEGSVHAVGAGAPVSAHFVNNVLAAAASYIEDDPDHARDILAELGQFLSFRLRETPAPVPISQELAHVANYLRLQQARFPDRIQSDLSHGAGAGAGGRMVEPGSVQGPIAEALSRRLGESAGPVGLVLRAAGDGFELELSGQDGAGRERLGIGLTTVEGMLS